MSRIPLLALSFTLLATGCSSTKQWETNRRNIATSIEQFEDGDLRVIAARMNGLLADTEEDRGSFALQRFYANYMLAQVHTAGSLDRPFLKETTTAASAVGGIGRRDTGDGPDQRESVHGHLAASILHASAARELYDAAARSGPKYEDVTLLPEELWNLGVANADANLQIAITTALARMGFDAQVEKVLDASPADFLKKDGALAYMDQYQVQKKLQPWVCWMIFDYLAHDPSHDEREAYYFGVLAVEGGDRFGSPLPTELVTAIESWIVDESKYSYRCPESNTAYIPGERSSPISGVAHIDYIAIAKEDVEGP